jgi:hypothetical protein
MDLDILQFCAPALKQALTTNRAILMAEKDEALGLTKKKAAAAAPAGMCCAASSSTLISAHAIVHFPRSEEEGRR